MKPCPDIIITHERARDCLHHRDYFTPWSYSYIYRDRIVFSDRGNFASRYISRIAPECLVRLLKQIETCQVHVYLTRVTVSTCRAFYYFDYRIAIFLACIIWIRFFECRILFIY